MVPLASLGGAASAVVDASEPASTAGVTHWSSVPGASTVPPDAHAVFVLVAPATQEYRVSFVPPGPSRGAPAQAGHPEPAQLRARP